MHYLFFRVLKKDICLIKNILESYENLMILSTVDEALSKVQITIAPDFLKDCRVILEDLKTHFLMEEILDPGHLSQGNY